jgi:hypothetical protein
MSAPYIPNRDADLDTWSANFSTLLTASPATYGLVAGDATAVAGVVAAWHTAYLAATAPSTRTPTSVAAKDAARVTMLATVRPYAQRIAANAGVTAGQKIAIGVSPRTNTPTPIAAPVTYPVLSIDVALNSSHVIRARDQLASPSVKAKPFGAVLLELHGAILPSGSPSVTLPLLPVLALVTKVPTQVAWSPTNAGSTAIYAARWATRTGLYGPFGPAVTMTVAVSGVI